MYSNFWNLRVSDRLAEWKDIRHKISDMPLPRALEEVNLMWSTAPFVTYYLDPSDPNNWPDPWTLLAENYWCEVAKSLGIIYTIYFSSHKNVPIEYNIYYDHNDKTRYNLVQIDNGKYILNCYPFEIVNTEHIETKNLHLLYSYSKDDLQLDRY